MTAKRIATPSRLLVVDEDARYGQWLGHHLGVFCPDSTVTVLDSAGFEHWREKDGGHECDILLLTASFGSSPEDPKARGLEILRQLRNRPVFPAVIALAEDGNELTAVRALQLGAVDYLPKRLLTPERLSTSVRLALRRIEKRALRKLATAAQVLPTPQEPPAPQEQKLDSAAAAETWASMTLTPGVAPKPVAPAAKPGPTAATPDDVKREAAVADVNIAAATQLMAPGQLEAILNSASAAALNAAVAASESASSKAPDTSFTGSIVASPSKSKGSPGRSGASKRSSTPAPPVTAEFIPGYIIKMKIGESEKAVVYLATSIALAANVALKVSKTLRDDAAGRQFLEREYTAIIAIRDPLVVQIYDYGVHAGFEYLAMEYLLSGDLKARMQAGLKETEALRYVEQIAAALRVVHNAGLLHRDLKPPNVMLRENDEVALIDFGLARALDGSTPSTRTGVLRGSPYYMSPEQAQGEQLDVRSDFYSLGIMLYEMLTGRKPYTGATAMEVLQQHVSSPLPPLPHSLARYEPFLYKLSAKNRTERFTKADEIIAAVAELRAAMALDMESAVA